MASIQVTINGTDRTERVEMNSLRIENILTRKRDTCTFSILDKPSASFTPVVGQEVIVNFDPGSGSSRVFGGVIVELGQEVTAYKLIRWRIMCEDFTRLLDRRLVPDSYENQTVDAIVADLKTKYFPSGFTTTNVDAPVEIKYVQFNYKPLSRCLEDLANMIGYDWYVDENKDIHFFDTASNPAPVDIEDNTGVIVYDTLTIRRDNSQVRNSIVVRGGEYIANSFTGEIEANGVDFVFPLPYKFADFHATLTGNPLGVGVDYIDDAESYHVLYNFHEKILRFKSSDVPSSGAVLVYSGKPYLPVIVKLSSTGSISTLSASEGGDGVYEYLIIDKSINSKAGARQRARAELETYATTMSEGEFETFTDGFRAGQRVLINSTSRGINEYFVVNKVTFRQFGATDFSYRVSLVTTKSFDLIDLLIKMALAKNTEIKIDPTEKVDIIVGIEDSMVMADSLGTFTANTPPYTYDSPRARYNRSTWS